jgi:diguanylate cyclase (GGDEF)-like protein
LRSRLGLRVGRARSRTPKGAGLVDSASGRRRRSVGVTTLLVTLVLIPLSGMTAMGVSAVSARRTTVLHATHINQSLSRVDALIALRKALYYEQAAAQVHLRAAQLGATAARASSQLGLGSDIQTGDVRAATDRALAGFARSKLPTGGMTSMTPAEGTASSMGPIDAMTLAHLRAEIDRGAVSADAAAVGYSALDAQAEASLRSLLNWLASMISRVDGGYRTWSALEALHAVSDGLGSGAAEVSDMSRLSLDQAADPSTALIRLGGATARYDEARDRFGDTGLPGLSNAWGQIEMNPAVAVYSQAVARAEVGPRAAQAAFRQDPDAAFRVLRGGSIRADLLFALLTRASGSVHSGADRLVSAAAADYHRWLFGLLGLALITIVVALAVARFITRPMRRLANRARAVSAGHLDVELSSRPGPKETAVVARAFDDLVANLRLLEAKSQALSNCDFTNPVLSQPLPGLLGRSIESSVRVLSGSIEERAKLQDSLEYQATHDALTGLYNRSAAVSALEHGLARSRRTGDAMGVLSIDLDDFKRANDNHGHSVGDEILKEIGARMQTIARAGDVLARLGGDEFLLIAERIGDSGQASALARRLINAVAIPVQRQGLRLTVGACVGVAMALDGHDEPGQLLAHADLALCRAKERGRANIELYDKSLQDELRQRDDIERALALALNNDGDELVLHYQPVIDSNSGRLTGLEALIRWHRPGSSVLPPNEFIPVAEASDLIIDLDVWVLRKVARQIASWSQHPEFADVSVAVNISGRHLLSRRLNDHLQTVLDETAIDPRRLIFEITETVVLSDMLTAADELKKIRAVCHER